MVYMLRVSLVFHTLVPLIDLNNVKTEHKPPFIFRHPDPCSISRVDTERTTGYYLEEEPPRLHTILSAHYAHIKARENVLAKGENCR